MKKNDKIALWVGIGLVSVGLASYVAYTLVKKRKQTPPSIDSKKEELGKDTIIG